MGIEKVVAMALVAVGAVAVAGAGAEETVAVAAGAREIEVAFDVEDLHPGRRGGLVGWTWMLWEDRTAGVAGKALAQLRWEARPGTAPPLVQG